MEREESRDGIRARLASKKVGIAGAGGLGSNCAVALARAGVGTLVIADFDRVSGQNLDRQAYYLDQVGRLKVEALAENIARIDPAIRVECSALRLDADSAALLFRGCDLVVEALDAAQSKLMLIEALQARLPATYLVGASGLAGYGATEAMRVRRAGTLVMVGDFESGVGEDLPPMAPRVGIAACMEANEAIALLLRGGGGMKA